VSFFLLLGGGSCTAFLFCAAVRNGWVGLSWQRTTAEFLLHGDAMDVIVFVCLTTAGYCTHPALDLHRSAKLHDHIVSPPSLRQTTSAILSHLDITGYCTDESFLENFKLLATLTTAG